MSSDLALALCLECQRSEDSTLRLVVMSATLGGGEAERVAMLMGGQVPRTMLNAPPSTERVILLGGGPNQWYEPAESPKVEVSATSVDMPAVSAYNANDFSSAALTQFAGVSMVTSQGRSYPVGKSNIRSELLI